MARADQRKQQLEQWVARHCGGVLVEGVSASSDASFRRYFRFVYPEQSLIAMDAPPAQEDCRPFVQIAGLLADAGVAVPHIVAQDLERGFLLLTDLGKQTYLDVLNEQNADALFADAITTLLRMQQHVGTDSLPQYDEALLRRELALFPEWYLQRHLGLDIDQRLRSQLDDVFERLIDNALAQAKVFVHRDYMPRNLMLSEPNPGVLDFQDAVCGPISYDPLCLFKDAFISWPEQKVQQWLQHYWQQAQDSGLPVPDSFQHFQKDCDFIGAQRHLKVIGIFARICHRDGKPRYLQDVPRFFAYLKTAAERHPELATLSSLLTDLATLSANRAKQKGS